MVGGGSKWREKSTSQMKAAKTNVDSRVDEAGRFVEAELRLLTTKF